MPSSAHSLVLAMTDIVDSTATTVQLGDRRAAALWAAHDRVARDLLATWHGREIDKSDGFLLVFDAVPDALGYLDAYHAALATCEPALHARAGVHVGPMRVRENAASDVARGAKPVEVDGAAKPATARIMALARPGQTLLSAAARAALPAEHDAPLRSHGHWRFKGIDEAIELFETGRDAARFAPPPDGPKGWRVVRRNELWVPARELPHSLPAERDRFIGRDRALRELADRFAGGARLVSLAGAGGTGKTRLALRFGWTWLGDFPGGIWFLDLSAARSVDAVVHAAAQGLRLASLGADPSRQVGDAIAGRGACLVIADNFEQVAAHAEATLGRWLERAPDAKFLVTTRERLGIVGEDMLPLPPLPADDAATMLHERAASAGAAPFSVDDEAAVPQLVVLLEGLPLAIELAASRMGVLSPARMLPRMGERFDVLKSSRGRHDRQATLRATLDWSWDLLADPERAVLARLSLFENGFTLDAAEAAVDVAAGGGESLVEVVQALVDKSLLRKVGDARFDMLRSVQEYAAERLPAEARAGTARAHALHFLRWLEQLRAGIANSDRRVLALLDADFENCRAAWRWAALHGQPETLLRSGDTLMHFWDHRGRFEEALEWLRFAIDARPADADPRFEPLLASMVAHFQYRLDRYADAQATAGRALRACRRNRDEETRLQCLKVLGACCIALGGHARAVRRLRLALKLSLARDDALAAAGMLDNLALVEKAIGRYDESLQLSTQSLAQYRRLGHVAGEALCLNNIGALQMDRGRHDDASSHLRAALALCERHDLVSTRCLVLANLTELALKDDDLAAAQAHAGGALAIARHIGSRTIEAWLVHHLARIALRSGDLTAARLRLRESMQLAIAIGRPSVQLEGVVAFADILVDEGELAAACSALVFAARHPAMSQLGRDALQRRLAESVTVAPVELDLDLDELARRIVDETDSRHARLIQLLRGSR